MNRHPDVAKYRGSGVSAYFRSRSRGHADFLSGENRGVAVFKMDSPAWPGLLKIPREPERFFESSRRIPELSEGKIRPLLRLLRQKPFRSILGIFETSGYDFTPHADKLGFFASRSVYVTIKPELSKDRVFLSKYESIVGVRSGV